MHKTHQRWILKCERWQATTSNNLENISQKSTSVYSHIRTHHPASSCTDNMVRDRGAGRCTAGQRESTCVYVCVCVRESGRRWLGVSSLTFSGPPPLSGLHLRKWILQSVYSALEDKTNTWDAKKLALVDKPPSFSFTFTLFTLSSHFLLLLL